MSWNPLRRVRERREAELESVDRWRIARRVADLHLDTLADDLDDRTAHHYGRALEHYEQARDAVRASTTEADVFAVERTVAVCAADARRLEGGESLEVRMVRVGDRYVPSREAGGVAAVVDRHRTMRDERPESPHRKNLAEAYIDQAINGPDGRFG